LPATFLLAAFLVAMLDSRSIGPLRQRRSSRYHHRHAGQV